MKNIPSNGSQIHQQFSETSKIGKNSLELSIEWSLFNINFLFDQLLNQGFNSALTISQIYGFPNIDLTNNHPANIEKALNYCLQKAYPFPSDNNENDAAVYSSVDDRVKRSRQYAIDEVSRDLVICSQAFNSKLQSCSEFSLSSDFLSINGSTNSGLFAIKCKIPIDDIGISEYVMSTTSQELFDDWTIGQNLEEYDYKLDGFENIIGTSTSSLNILEKSQEETSFNDTSEYEFSSVIANKAINNSLTRVESSSNISKSTLNISEDAHKDRQEQSNALEKPKKKSRRSGFR